MKVYLSLVAIAEAVFVLAQSAVTASGSELLAINTLSREEVIARFHTMYVRTAYVESGWNGGVTNCVAGTLRKEYQDATLLRVNYFRAMARLLGDVVFDETKNAKCQQAALMMAAQGVLSHYPSPEWACYSAEGAEAAGHSNLGLGLAGPGAIDGYIDDEGPDNAPVGHRWWVLRPGTSVMGSGSIPATPGAGGANALWVSGGTPAPEFWALSPGIMWPPIGFVPYSLLPSSGRWSFTYDGADVSHASVSMWHEGNKVDVVIEKRALDSNTLVWKPNLPILLGVNGGDAALMVTVSDVVIKGVAKTFAYPVVVVNPYRPLGAVSVLGVPSVDADQVALQRALTQMQIDAIARHRVMILQRIFSAKPLTLEEQRIVSGAVHYKRGLYKFSSREVEVLLAVLQRDTAAKLFFGRNGDQLILSWDDSTAWLYEADDISGAWRWVDGAFFSPYITPFSSSNKFYKLIVR